MKNEIFQTEDENIALDYETKVIKLIGRSDIQTGILTNLTDGGEKSNLSNETRMKMRMKKLGTKVSDETRLKMSEQHKGSKNSFYGKSHSKLSKKKISLNRKGKASGVAHGMYGKTHSSEARKKISDARKKITGIKHHRSRSYMVISPKGNEFIIHGAFDKTCKELGIKNVKYLREVAQGKRKDCNGWRCIYLK